MLPAIVIIIILVIAVLIIKSYLKKMSSGCCGAGGDKEKHIAPKDTDLTSYSYLTDVKIGGMHCKKCATRIDNAFNKKDGYYAIADFKDGSAKIYSKRQLTDFDIRSVIVGLDYSVIDIKRSCAADNADN